MVDISLAPRLWPELRLHPLNEQGIFDPAMQPVPLDRWLMQPVPPGTGGTLTLRKLIRRVCDQQGGAHVDLKSRTGLQDVPDVPSWIRKAGLEVQAALAERLSGR